MSGEQYRAEEARLYAALESAADAFLAGRDDPPARAAARAFLARFSDLSEPGLGSHYRALSPEFWAWAEAAARP